MFKVKEYGPSNAENVAFIFSGAGIPAWQMLLPRLPISTFKKAGWRVIFYEYSWKVVKTADIYLKTIDAVYSDASRRLADLNDPKRVLSVGISLGSLPATRLAASSKQIKGLILNVPYTDPMTNLYDFGPTVVIPKNHATKFLKSAESPEKVDTVMSKYSPLKNAERLNHVKVLLFIARKDKFFLYRHSSKLRSALQKSAKHFVCFEAQSLGHWLGGSKYNLRSSRWLEWLT